MGALQLIFMYLEMYLQLYATIFLPYNINCNPFLWLTITTCICKLLLCKRSSLHNRKYRHIIYVTLLYTKYATWNSYFFICSIHNLNSFKSHLEADGNYFTSISFYIKTCLRQWKNSKILAGGSTVSFFRNIDFKRIRAGSTERYRQGSGGEAYCR